MLQTLRVKNLAIVENIEVVFGPGLNVITGETGAGKSILMGALNLVLGGRADKAMIRGGEEQCAVEALFALSDVADINALLEELGLDPCEDGQLIVRRLITAAGAGRNLINGGSATAQMLKRVGDLLVDMHGPHDHQSLLEHHFQLQVLDSFAQAPEERAAYGAAYDAMLALQTDIRALDGDDQQVALQIDMLSFQVKELEDADLTESDEDELQREHMRVANAQRILELTGAAHEALTEDEASAFDLLARTQSALHELASLWDDAAPWREEARSIAVQIQELSDTVNRAAQSIDADPQRLQWLEDRMALVRKLKQKYGATVPEVLAFLDGARQRLTELTTRGERLAELAAKLEKAEARVQTAGRALSARRATAAKALAKAVTRELRDLGFAHGAFDVTLESRAPGPSGLDAVEFGFAPNVGEPVRPLRAIASSGEISRVMLATKTVLAAHDRIPVLVFDEIDANIGGETANAVGGKLASVADSHQVLCITHLPQVAVHGASHHVVAKHVEGGRTRTAISSLNPHERSEEIARMLGGKDLTSVTMRHAREMLRKTAR